MWKFAFMFFFSISLLLGGIVEAGAGCQGTTIPGVLSQAEGDLNRCDTAIRENNRSNFDNYMSSAERYHDRADGYAGSGDNCAAEIGAIGRRIRETKKHRPLGPKLKSPNKKYRLPPGAPKLNIPRN